MDVIHLLFEPRVLPLIFVRALLSRHQFSQHDIVDMEYKRERTIICEWLEFAGLA